MKFKVVTSKFQHPFIMEQEKGVHLREIPAGNMVAGTASDTVSNSICSVLTELIQEK